MFPTDFVYTPGAADYIVVVDWDIAADWHIAVDYHTAADLDKAAAGCSCCYSCQQEVHRQQVKRAQFLEEFLRSCFHFSMRQRGIYKLPRQSIRSLQLGEQSKQSQIQMICH